MDTERQARWHPDRVILWAMVLSLLLHCVLLAWVGIKFPGLSRVVRVESPTPLRVKLNRGDSVVIQKEAATTRTPELATDKASPVDHQNAQETKQALGDDSFPSGLESTTIGYRNLPNAEPEELDMTASPYAIQELDLSQDKPDPVQNRRVFADVFDPQVRQRLQLSDQNRTVTRPNLFQQMNNRALSGGSQMMSFGDACFEVADDIRARSNKKMWLRTQCLGKTLSERMLDNVEKVLETEQVELP